MFVHMYIVVCMNASAFFGTKKSYDKEATVSIHLSNEMFVWFIFTLTIHSSCSPIPQSIWSYILPLDPTLLPSERILATDVFAWCPFSPESLCCWGVV